MLDKPTIDVADKYCEDSHEKAQEAQRPKLLSFRAFCASLWPLIGRIGISIFNRRSNKGEVYV